MLHAKAAGHMGINGGGTQKSPCRLPVTLVIHSIKKSHARTELCTCSGKKHENR
jgi:hypothetical protein